MHRHVAGAAVAVGAACDANAFPCEKNAGFSATHSAKTTKSRHGKSGRKRASRDRPAVSRSGRSKRHAADRSYAARRKEHAPQLQTTQPVLTALIDPVPRGQISGAAAAQRIARVAGAAKCAVGEEGLTRIQDDADLLAMRREGELVGCQRAQRWLSMSGFRRTGDTAAHGRRNFCPTCRACTTDDFIGRCRSTRRCGRLSISAIWSW